MFRLLSLATMSETVEHEALEEDAAKAASELLARLNLKSLSFVQLRRLQKSFRQASAEIDRETARRTEVENFGDTVTVPPKKV